MTLKSFADLTAREILAVAIASEEEDSRIYATFAEDLSERYPASARVFEEMAEEEKAHRHMLLEMYEQRFGPNLPPIRREDVKGFLKRRPIWLTKNLPLETIRKEAENMEYQAARFYEKAADQTTDVEIRKLLGDLAEVEKSHGRHAGELERSLLTEEARAEEAGTNHRMFVLQYVQPGLAGLMDGSVSTLAPLFAAAFATHANWETFLVGLAASIGAGISMGFAEALSDDGALTGSWDALAARHDLRRHDHAWSGLGHTLALSGARHDPQCVLDRHRHRGRRGVHRAVADRLDSCAVHGYAIPAGGFPDRSGRSHRAGGRNSDRRRLTGEGREATESAVTFVLAHLSDAHIGPLPRPHRRELLGKRLTGYINWRRGRDRLHNMEVLARLVADIRAQQPDHIAMTGDVLNIGLAAEFPFASAWLATLGESRDVSFVPGNHDAYTRGSLMHLERTFAPWTGADLGGEPSYPYLRVRGEIALIGLSSGIPTAPLLASGRLGTEQRDRLEIVLAETGARGLMRVVMIHHPPNRGGASAGRGLTDARKFEAILARHGAELVIHGHNHRHSVVYLPGPKGRIPIVGVASASAIPGTERHRAAYHLYEISRGENGWRIEGRMRGVGSGSDEIKDLGTFPV